jgi:hypothetical protein
MHDELRRLVPRFVRERTGQLSGASDDLRAEVLDVVSDGRPSRDPGPVHRDRSGGIVPGVGPTGRPFDIEGMHIVLVDDRHALFEDYAILDMKAAMEQLGLVPSMR